MAKKLPKRIYVKWQEESNESFLLADSDYVGLSIAEDVVEVGEYELKAVRELDNKTKLL